MIQVTLRAATSRSGVYRRKQAVRPTGRERRYLKVGGARHSVVARFVRRPQLSA